ncbi:hypothetical protein V8G54_001251 [Vigna mungo]|uniref:Uncharacterized protein n=1 Tax=Vigna mungo TaxID=3915 RepID=A0AAQ3P8E3_VIGMU
MNCCNTHFFSRINLVLFESFSESHESQFWFDSMPVGGIVHRSHSKTARVMQSNLKNPNYFCTNLIRKRDKMVVLFFPVMFIHYFSFFYLLASQRNLLSPPMALIHLSVFS